MTKLVPFIAGLIMTLIPNFLVLSSELRNALHACLILRIEEILNLQLNVINLGAAEQPNIA